MYLFVYFIRIYHDALSLECQIQSDVLSAVAMMSVNTS